MNAFLSTVQEYQKKRLKDLDTTLIERLRSVGKLSDITLAKGREKLKEIVLAINVVPVKWKQIIKMKAIWAFSVSVSLLALDKGGEMKTRNFLESQINKMYASMNSLETDSARNIIFHNIAGTETMPEEWRKFISSEDSLELLNMNQSQESVDESKNKSTEFENKVDYIVLQQMNAQYGNPKVQYGQNEGDKDRASYSSGENSMFLPTHAGKFRLNDYFAELAHAKQFNGNDSDKYDVWNMKDYHKYDSIAKAEKISYHDAQLREYSDPTTLEHEAHRKIQPTFALEFERRKKALIDTLLQPTKPLK